MQVLSAIEEPLPTTVKVKRWAFVPGIPDPERSAGHFRDELAFTLLGEDAADRRLVTRDGIRIRLGRYPTEKLASAVGAQRWLDPRNASDVNALQARLVRPGAAGSVPKAVASGWFDIDRHGSQGPTRPEPSA